MWDIPDETYDRMLKLAVRELELEPVLHTFARELSLGQRMRADLAMLLLHDPELILLDEPTLGLDVLSKQRMIDVLHMLNSERGATILVTSHDMDAVSYTHLDGYKRQIMDCGTISATREMALDVEDAMCEVAAAVALSQLKEGFPVRMPLSSSRPLEVSGQSLADFGRFLTCLLYTSRCV